jgi:transposase
MKENRWVITEEMVVGGVDTHKDVHVAAVLSDTGALLGTAEFAATLGGHKDLLGWMRSFGDIGSVGVEGSGNYGAGLTRFLLAEEVGVVEVVRPDRRARRLNGKSDTLDAENAARGVLAGERTSAPKHRDGTVEALRALRVARTSAVKARRAALQLLRNTIVSAPDGLRETVSDLARTMLVRLCATWRPNRDAAHDPTTAARIALRSLASPTVTLSIIALPSVGWSTVRVPDIGHSGAFLGSRKGMSELLNGPLGLSVTVGLGAFCGSKKRSRTSMS